MPREETPLLTRLSTGLSALLDAGCCSEKIAAALKDLMPGALAAGCRLDETAGTLVSRALKAYRSVPR